MSDRARWGLAVFVVATAAALVIDQVAAPIYPGIVGAIALSAYVVGVSVGSGE